jgi:hypothetical protein
VTGDTLKSPVSRGFGFLPQGFEEVPDKVLSRGKAQNVAAATGSSPVKNVKNIT